MKILSVAIPCYNSQDYMRHCVETLVSGGEQMDIMIIDDGSKDRTLDIARELEITKSPASEILNKLLSIGAIVPVIGAGKGKYRFNQDFFNY